MGFIDKIKDAVSGNTDKADGAIDKVADMVDDKTGGKHHDKIDGVAQKAKGLVDKLDDGSDTDAK
ncbi:MAG: antitoxin [Aquihabitans sp.]